MEGLAEKVRGILQKLDINTPPISVQAAADLFLVSVIHYPKFPDHVSGMLVHKDGRVVIGVNASHSDVRKRFTIAHELGHYLSGHEIDEKIIDDVFDKPTEKEVEANDFAAELLMPRHFLAADLKTKNNNLTISDLAKRYQVSEQAMSVRLLKTGLISKL